MSRWCAGLVASLGLLLVAQAEAQTCESDDECGKGEWCAGEDGDHGGGIAEPAPCDPGDDGVCEQPEPPDAPDLTCQPIGPGVCESDADCVEGLGCEKGVWVPGCAPPDEGGVDTCDDDPRVERYGRCTYVPPSCERDDECLEGLRCAENPEGSVSSPPSSGDDPGVPPVEKSDAKVCVFAPPTCTKSADCTADYECAEIVISRGCSGSSGGCSADGECEEEPVEETCDEEKANYCLPKEIECSDDGACPSDWKCLAFADGLEPLPNWSDVEGKRCVPEGVALVIESSKAGGGFGSVGEGTDDASSGPQPESSSSGSGSSNCSVAHGGSSGVLFSLLGLAGLMMQRRRSSRARVRD